MPASHAFWCASLVISLMIQDVSTLRACQPLILSKSQVESLASDLSALRLTLTPTNYYQGSSSDVPLQVITKHNRNRVNTEYTHDINSYKQT
ncbi:hypothetical protein C7974DRAFT_170435 [Boeremia exigua]|uniref:uncharacterized protein n=1 Tax=Boeremia exigua TaxID=749465 RepID=UPI001E8E0AAE|nr:uncharacterized protein C7974DRAFT_170435 [Boeremia exigua]KAH6633385.1 hypothetical protein C7974DRAFT_170435 [Boeremia exigua]